MEIRINHPDITLGVIEFLKATPVRLGLHTRIIYKGAVVGIISPYPNELLDTVKEMFATSSNPRYIEDKYGVIIFDRDTYYNLTKI